MCPRCRRSCQVAHCLDIGGSTCRGENELDPRARLSPQSQNGCSTLVPSRAGVGSALAVSLPLPLLA
eukprot:1568558-Pyramimonas_sp.AAC.1